MCIILCAGIPPYIGERLCDSNCTDSVQSNGNTTQVSEAVGPNIAIIATVLAAGVILLVLIIIGTVLVVFCLKRKQDRKQGQAVGMQIHP